jgi:single-strand DNA-binding protein
LLTKKKEAGMSKIIITGNVGRDAELKQGKSGRPFTSFSVADKNPFSGDTTWWMCTLFGNMAEKLHSYIKRGNFIVVFGRPDCGTWVEKNGEIKINYNCVVDSIVFGGGAKDKGEKLPTTGAGNSNKLTFETDDIPF